MRKGTLETKKEHHLGRHADVCQMYASFLVVNLICVAMNPVSLLSLD